jgi:beta-phosphoglucomutase family hydrolase
VRDATGDGGPGLEAVLFDLDGVLTRTAAVHAGAWKEAFDAFLRRHADATGEPFVPFDADAEYHDHVDGRPRLDGVRAFLAARGIPLPEGGPDDGPDADTVHGLARRKNDRFEALLRERGVEVFPGSVRLLRDLRAAGLRTGLVTSSRHGRAVVAAAGLTALFDAMVDGADAAALGLRGKPAPDLFVTCAARLGVEPGRAAVVEDAVAGVQAGERGGFGLVVGVDRGGQRDALLARGAGIVVPDLGSLRSDDLVVALREAREASIPRRVVQEGYDPAREHEMESLFALSNGRLGVRGALDTPLPGSHDDLFVAGVYDEARAGTSLGEPGLVHVLGRDDAEAELVRLPSPFRLRLSVGGVALDLSGDVWRAHRRVLDLQRAELRVATRFVTGPDRHVAVRTLRCASAADPCLLLHEIRVVLENHSADVVLDAALASLADPGVDAPHVVALPAEPVDGIDVRRFATRASGVELCVAARTTLVGHGQEAPPPSTPSTWRVAARIGEPLVFRRVIAVCTSRDADDPRRAAVERVRAVADDAFDDALAAHGARWRETWTRAGVHVEGDPAGEQALRFLAYHLTAAAGDDPRVSVGARGLTGRAYQGHVFWDVETFMLPFWVHTSPALARSALAYRHRTLDGARRRARDLGLRGACYAWESTLSGADVTPREVLVGTSKARVPIFTGTEQIHVTADVAHAVWRYVEATDDRTFLAEQGAEILVETARFWADRCTEEGGTRHLRGVIGPDEYHHGVDDNAYTNWMARLNLERAVDVAARLAREAPAAWGALVERCGIGADEPATWAEVARTLLCPVPDARGVIEQFAGFFDLEDVALPEEERFTSPIRHLFEWDRLQRLKVVKQADVLMLLHLCPERFGRDALAANYRYYEPLTDHGSSLSPPVHAAVAARLGLRDDAERYWRRSVGIDLSDVMGNAALGVHLASMGGTWQALVLGVLGVRFDDDGPVVAPDAAARLPSGWRRVALRLAWRGRVHPVEVTAPEATP